MWRTPIHSTLKKLLKQLASHQPPAGPHQQLLHMIWPKACLLLTGRQRRKGDMGGAGVGVVEGAAGAVEEDDRRSCAVLTIRYCCFAHLLLS